MMTDNYYCDLSNQQALESALNEYGDRLVAYINAFTKDVHAAEDLMMDIFVVLIKNGLKFESENQFRAYVYKCARSRALNHLKSQKRIVPLSDEVLNDNYYIEEKFFSSLKKKKLYEAMGKLPIKYKQVLYLSYIEGMKLDEVAEILELSCEAAKSLKQRAKKKLNGVLKKENYVFEEGENED